MSTTFVISAAHQMLVVALELMTPFLFAALSSSLVIGLLQASTRINDLTLSFVPRFAAVLLVIYFAASWASGQLTGYIERSIIAVGAFTG